MLDTENCADMVERIPEPRAASLGKGTPDFPVE